HRLLAMGSYLRLLTGWLPEPIPLPTLLIQARDPLAGAPDRPPWPSPHEQLAVAGDHFSMLEEHSGELATALAGWLSDRFPNPPTEPGGPTTVAINPRSEDA
ncbi:MAG: hypothetical protein M3Y42_18850, partial [Actinomycetota bacterium]|nr:hypothetical protein [Actinomycetota bacterium]